MARKSIPAPARKKARTEHAPSSELLKKVQSLEKDITGALESGSSLNALVDLLHLGSSAEDAQAALKVIYACYRIYVLVFQTKSLVAPAQDVDAEKKAVRVWLWDKFDRLFALLSGFLSDEDAILRTSSLKILFSLLQHQSKALLENKNPSSDGILSSVIKKIAAALLCCPPSSRVPVKLENNTSEVLQPDVRAMFLNDWFQQYADIRWHFLRHFAIILSGPKILASNPHIPSNALSILENFNKMPTSKPSLKKGEKGEGWEHWWLAGNEKHKASETDLDIDPMDDEDWRKFFDDAEDSNPQLDPAEKKRIHDMTIKQHLHSLASHRVVFTKCWLSLLPLLSRNGTVKRRRGDEEDEDEDKEVLATRALNVMHLNVMPHLSRAVMVMDWVADRVDIGGSVGLLALNALYVLIRDYNLDYPQFYTRLYAFLDRDVLHLKHRTRFFRLTDLFLSSTHLPAALLASFVKRLSRLSITAPPSAIVFIIPLVYNILKRHPALMVMIHRDEPNGTVIDPFDPAEPNPMNTKAIDSSLWELHSHRQHYHSAVSSLTKIFEEPFTKPGYALEDFFDHTYATIFQTEVSRKMKKDPAVIELEMKAAQALAEEDVIAQFWTLT